MLDKLDPTNESLVIIGLIALAFVSIIMLGVEGKEIAIAIGGGLIGYLRGKQSAL